MSERDPLDVDKLVRSICECSLRFQDARKVAIEEGNKFCDLLRLLPLHTHLRMGDGKSKVVFVIVGHGENNCIQYRLSEEEIRRFFGKRFPSLRLSDVTAFRLPFKSTWHEVSFK